MGYAERSYSYRFGSGDFGFGGGGGTGGALSPWVKRLLVANAAVYLLNIVGLLPRGWTFMHFGFVPDPGHLLTHPWTPLTYMFVHGNFWHILFNMVILFFFGPPLERTWGSSYFIRFYVVAGLGGALFSFLLMPVVGVHSMVGASGALYGLLLAFALNWPEAPIYIWGILPIRAKWFVGILAAIALFGTFSGSGSGVASWAHLGGLVTGFAYLKGGDRVEAWLRERGWTGSRRSRRKRRTDGRLRIHRKDPGSSSSKTPRRRSPTTGSSGDDLDRVNAILDKIREEGMDSLTREEREFLDEMSRRYRGPG